MAFCTSCGHDLEGAEFCVNCGTRFQTESAEALTSSVSSDVSPVTESEKAKTTNQNKVLIYSGIAVGLIVVFLIITFSTAKKWTKIDVPAHAETFRTETYLTGYYDVFDNKVSPCWVGQNWYNCINTYVAEYNATCASFPLSSSASILCSNYSNMIDDMRSRGNSWSIVSSLGSWGTLSISAEEDTRQVSNNDYRPAKTHEAVCYLGFLGECEP